MNKAEIVDLYDECLENINQWNQFRTVLTMGTLGHSSVHEPERF